jgi:DNA-binding PadR family transcriptional regulator
MSDARTTDFCGEAVLGLVIEQPDHRFRLKRRLEARFPSAQFTHSRTYKAIGRLEREGYVRAVGAEHDRRGVVYEATPEGIEHNRDWVCAPTNALVSREELHAKISLCQPRDLPRLIDVIYAEECAYAAELERIRDRTVAEQGDGGPVPLAEREWSELMGNAVVHGEADNAGGRITQLQGLRGYLEELRDEAERRALADHRRAVAEIRPAAEHRRPVAEDRRTA